MGFFSIRNNGSRYGVLIDIGSGSVLAAIIHSDPSLEHPVIIWSNREHAPLRNIDTIEQSAKAVMTALVNVSMQLDAEGRKALYDYDSGARLSELQCSISAPWSYTVTKTANFRQESPFIITTDLVNELRESIGRQIEEDLESNETLQNLGLEITTHCTMDVLSNGYRVLDPVGQKSNSFAISHASVVAQEYLVDAIDEMRNKLFVETRLSKISFILVLFSVVRELFPGTYDICLVDITYEATEIGIVRDGTLKYSTHTPFGSFSLAREISIITGAPLHEAFSYLHTEKPYSFIESLNSEQKQQISTVFEEYTKRVSELFHETGDTLSIPKRIAIHSDLNSESLYTDLIEKAAKQALKSKPSITSITTEIISRAYQMDSEEVKRVIQGDTALLLSARFFHRGNKEYKFEYF